MIGKREDARRSALQSAALHAWTSRRRREHMARTRAFSALRRSLLLAHGASQRGISAREHAAQLRAAFRPTRRELLKAGFGLAASAAIGCNSEADAGGPRVAIIGAGMAGLLCAHRLKQGGIEATV